MAKIIYLSLAHMSKAGVELKYIREAFEKQDCGNVQRVFRGNVSSSQQGI